MSSLLELRGVSKRFGGLKAVDDVSFSVAQGEVIGLVGPNGSGKTTLMNLITGALPVTSGQIRFVDADIQNKPAHKISQAGIARTFQLVRIMETMTARENIAIGALHGALHLNHQEAAAKTDEIISMVGIAPIADVMAGQLTYIDQKRVELARALACDPKLLLLDEWLAGLNPTELQDGIALIARLRDAGITIIMIEHVMEAIRFLSDRCVVMNSGKLIADGAPDDALSAPEVVAAYLGAPEDEDELESAHA